MKSSVSAPDYTTMSSEDPVLRYVDAADAPTHQEDSLAPLKLRNEGLWRPLAAGDE